ncbi:MAG: DUF2971 domain-containing protein [Verrucomicrobiota bacterium]|jgi:hypothetical protein
METRRIIQSPALNAETKLYRYISFRQFVDFVETKQVSLSRIKDWPDTWEVPLAKLPMQTDDGPIQFSLWNIHESMFGQCWSLHKESDAMWRIYSQQNEGVVVETSVKKFDLLQDIKYAALGPVIYYDDLKVALSQIDRSRNGEYEIFTGAFLKRRAFEHEKEVRLVTMDDERCIVKRPPDGALRFYVDLDPSKFIEGITVDPRADDRHVETLQKYCQRAGLPVEPVKSMLYGNLYEQTRLVRRYVTVKKQK